MNGIMVVYQWDIGGISMEYWWNIYRRDMIGILMGYDWNLNGIIMEKYHVVSSSVAGKSPN